MRKKSHICEMSLYITIRHHNTIDIVTSIYVYLCRQIRFVCFTVTLVFVM